MQLIVPGKIQIFNVIQDKIRNTHVMQLRPNTAVVLLFDTDTDNESVLRQNIEFLKKTRNVKTVVCVTQVKNLEDELVRCCNIDAIKELLNSKSNSNFKRDLIKIHDLKAMLLKHQFDIDKLWVKNPQEGYVGIVNESAMIKYSVNKNGREYRN